MSLSRSVKFFRPIGIELTFVATSGRHSTFCKQKHKWGRHLEAAHAFRDRKYVGHIHCDTGCVEHSSPILRSWTGARRWYETAIDCADEAELTPFRPDWNGGGGHIHMGGLSMRQVQTLVADMVWRPYLPMATITHHDTRNALPFADPKWNLRRHFQHLELVCRPGNTARETLDFITDDYVYGLDIKNKCLRYKPETKTLEWRAFDSAADWEIQELQIALCQRWAQKTCSERLRRVPSYDEAKMLVRGQKNFGWCAKMFKQLIVDHLELPWESYEWFVARNLEPRFW